MNSKNWVNRLISSSGKTFEKQITSAANAGQIDIGTVGGGSVIANVIIMSSNGSTTSDLNYASITSGPASTPTVSTHINGPSDGLKAYIDAQGKQVGWTGVTYLKAGDKIVMNLNGTGATAVDLDVVVRYVATTISGEIA